MTFYTCCKVFANWAHFCEILRIRRVRVRAVSGNHTNLSKYRKVSISTFCRGLKNEYLFSLFFIIVFYQQICLQNLLNIVFPLIKKQIHYLKNIDLFSLNKKWASLITKYVMLTSLKFSQHLQYCLMVCTYARSV